MNTKTAPSKNIRTQFVAGIVAGLLCWSAAAADARNDGTAKAKKPGAVAAVITGQQFGEVEFLAMPMNEVVDYLRDTMESPGVNFIVAEDIKDVEITLQLRNVSFDQLTKAIEIASEGRVLVEAVEDRLYHVRQGDVKVARTEPILRVFNLSKFLQGREETEAGRAIEDLHNTVGMAFEMLSEAQRAAGGSAARKARVPINSKFHPGTKLMIVIGSPDDVDVFGEVTSQLLGEPRRITRTLGGGMEGMGGMYGGEGSEEGFGYGGGNPGRSSGRSKSVGAGTPAKNPFGGSQQRR